MTIKVSTSGATDFWTQTHSFNYLDCVTNTVIEIDGSYSMNIETSVLKHSGWSAGSWGSLGDRPWIHEINLSRITVKENGVALPEGACGAYGYSILSATDRDPEFVHTGTSSTATSSNYGSLTGHQGYIYAIPTLNT